MITDQVFAGGIRRLAENDDKAAAVSHFVGGGAMLWLGWQVSCTAGYFAGQAIPAAWSLDFAVPLCFIAIVAPHLREMPMIAGGVIAAIAVVALDALPMRLNLISAGLLGIAAGTVVELWRERGRR